MPYELLAGLAGFALVSSITPGPNNLMLMASGANFGFRLTIPHMLGVGLGFTLMILLVGVGLVGLFEAWPHSYTALKVISVGYLLFLAWKIGTAAAPHGGESTGRPLNFLQAALFQWVNPKAWTMALTAVSVYAPTGSIAAVAAVAAVFGLINLPCVSLWAAAGQQLRELLSSRRRLTAFNAGMATLLLASLYPVLA